MKADIEIIINLFQTLGVTAQETKLYLALLREENLNGYQLSKNAGIPSSKIYVLIEKMLQRGFIIATETRPQRYFPQEPDKIMAELKETFSASIQSLQNTLNQYRKEDSGNGLLVWNVPSRQDVVKKAQETIDLAVNSIFLAIWPKDLRSIQASLTRAQDRGVIIKIVAYGKLNTELGAVYQHRASDYPSRERGERRFIVVADNKESLIANFGSKKASGGLFTKNVGLVNIFRDFVIHEIYIILLEQKFPEQVRELVGHDWEKARLF